MEESAISKLKELKEKVQEEFTWLDVQIQEGVITIEEDVEFDVDLKNDDHYVEQARETGEMIIEKFPELKIDEYFCHWGKYAITHLSLIKQLKQEQ